MKTKTNRRSDDEVKAKLDELKAATKAYLENKDYWGHEDKRQNIKALEWVLAMRDEL